MKEAASKSAITGFMLLIMLCVASCASVKGTRAIKAGDLVQVDYTCRLRDGGILATTLDEVASDESQLKSALFKPSRQAYRPVVMRAGGDVAGVETDDRRKSFKDHIAGQLAKRVVGLRTGERKTLELQDRLMEGLSEQDRFLSLARIWRYPKYETVARVECEKALGKSPEVGFEMPWRGPFIGKVAEVSEHFVKFEILVPPDTDMQTPFGTGKIRDGGERWEVEVNPREGTLVRSGPLLGRIAEVGDDVFRVDFGYPFGNEPLFCEVMAESPSEDGAGNLDQTSMSPEETEKGPAASGAAALDEAEDKPGPGRLAGTAGAAPDRMKAPEKAKTGAGDPLKAEHGDLVAVHYTAALEDGVLVQTNIRDIAEDPAVRRASWYRPPENFGPQEIVAGEDAVFPGLGDAALGMSAGEKKTVPLVPDQAFGLGDPNKIEKYDAVKRYPRVGVVSAKDYLQRFGILPIEGKEIQFTPYFKSRVISVTENDVTLEALAQDGGSVATEFGGTTEIRIEGDEVVLQLIPEIGAPFSVNDRQGVITAYDEKTFSVDFNHPLAGKPIILDVEVVSLVKASQLEAMEIPWHEDHDEGLHAAEHENKPAVVVLYSATCGWSSKLLDETLEDPRIKVLSDEFVWVKVDSQVEQDLYFFYEQSGYPLIIVLNPGGDVIRKISGYRPAALLKEELNEVISSYAPGHALVRATGH